MRELFQNIGLRFQEDLYFFVATDKKTKEAFVCAWLVPYLQLTSGAYPRGEHKLLRKHLYRLYGLARDEH